MLLLTACTEEPQTDARRLVLEAWIDNDGYPVAMLTWSLAPSESPVDVSDAMIRWGKVSITDGTDTVVMTGGVDYSLLPPYSYRSFKMMGEVGKTYTVIGEYGGHRVTATSRMMPPPQIESVSFVPLPDNDSLYSGEVTFVSAESADTSRYVVFTRVRNKDERYYPSMLGAVSAAPGRHKINAPLHRGAQMSQKYNPYFLYHDTVDVMVAHVDETVYRFWDGYQNVVYFGNNIFLSSATSLPTNVTGGYGIFSARGSATQCGVAF